MQLKGKIVKRQVSSLSIGDTVIYQNKVHIIEDISFSFATLNSDSELPLIAGKAALFELIIEQTDHVAVLIDTPHGTMMCGFREVAKNIFLLRHDQWQEVLDNGTIDNGVKYPFEVIVAANSPMAMKFAASLIRPRIDINKVRGSLHEAIYLAPLLNLLDSRKEFVDQQLNKIFNG